MVRGTISPANARSAGQTLATRDCVRAKPRKCLPEVILGVWQTNDFQPKSGKATRESRVIQKLTPETHKAW